MTDATDGPLTGTLLDGRFRIKRLLGEGAFGEVYEARDLPLERNVAIKTIRNECLSDVQIERLFREGRAAAMAEHPAVVIVHNHGADEELGIHFLVLELLRGVTLAQHLERLEQPERPEQRERRVNEASSRISLALKIGLEISGALAVVHDKQIIHRDIKPSNIFLVQRERRPLEIKLLDFGMAKLLNRTQLTTTGRITGTLMYMAPEQLSDSQLVGARSDLYALGAVLFECATGRRPRQSDNLADMVHEIAHGEPPDVRAHRDGLPPALADVIARCMRRDPAERMQSAGAVYEALAPLAER